MIHSKVLLHILIVFKANCGESINVLMDNGIITSPNFPNDYENLQTIKFVISVAEGSTISLIFEEFDVSILTPREFMFVYYYNEFIFRSNLMLIACMTQSQFMMGEMKMLLKLERFVETKILTRSNQVAIK